MNNDETMDAKNDIILKDEKAQSESSTCPKWPQEWFLHQSSSSNGLGLKVKILSVQKLK